MGANVSDVLPRPKFLWHKCVWSTSMLPYARVPYHTMETLESINDINAKHWNRRLENYGAIGIAGPMRFPRGDSVPAIASSSFLGVTHNFIRAELRLVDGAARARRRLDITRSSVRSTHADPLTFARNQTDDPQNRQ